MAVPAVPVMRVNTLGGSKCSPNVHKYQLTCYRNNDLAQFWKTSVTCERGFAQPCRVSFGLCLYPHKMAAPRLLRFLLQEAPLFAVRSPGQVRIHHRRSAGNCSKATDVVRARQPGLINP